MRPQKNCSSLSLSPHIKQVISALSALGAGELGSGLGSERKAGILSWQIRNENYSKRCCGASQIGIFFVPVLGNMFWKSSVDNYGRGGLGVGLRGSKALMGG